MFTGLMRQMITLLRLTGLALLVLVGYHYINEPLGFSVAGSIATAILALCLSVLYPAYQPDAGNWMGWGLICVGCFFLAGFTRPDWLLIIPGTMIMLGYRLAALPFDFGSPGAGCSDSGGDSSSCDGGGGD